MIVPSCSTVPLENPSMPVQKAARVIPLCGHLAVGSVQEPLTAEYVLPPELGGVSAYPDQLLLAKFLPTVACAPLV